MYIYLMIMVHDVDPSCSCNLLDRFASQDKPFPVRSVPQSLEKAANDSFEELSKKGLTGRDLIKAVSANLGACSFSL